MKKFFTIAALLAVCVGFSSQAMAADGGAIYKSKCLMCHGADGKGTAMGVALAGSEFIASSSDRVIAEVILKGREGDVKKYKNIALGMPAMKLSDDTGALVVYLRSLAVK
ncbi:MAG: cytochrome c [Deltaproteobacteria bacterium]|nr:cytochrome c [Deltaproteobacteria bacterium]